MSEYTVEDLYNGLCEESFKEHHLMFLQLLVNLAGSNSIDSNTDDNNTNDNSTSNEKGILIKLYEYILIKLNNSSSHDNEMINILLSLLANLTIDENNTTIFLNHINVNNDNDKDSNHDNSLRKSCYNIIDNFLDYNPHFENVDNSTDNDNNNEDIWYKFDPWQHTASVLCNFCRIDIGRKIILKQSSGYMEKLTLQIRSKNNCRRRGVIGCIKTCLFDNDIHWWMVHELKILTPLVIPLVVNTPFTDDEKNGMDPLIWMSAENPDKKRDNDDDIIKMILECIILLCQKRAIRDYIRKCKVYPVVRNLDYDQSNEDISSIIFEIVNFIYRDEDPDNND